MPSDTVVVSVACPDAQHDHLVAELADLPFYAFERADGVSRAFIDAELMSDAVADAAAAAARRVGGDAPHVSRIEPRNWNALWEASFEPIVVPPFVIRPSWAPSDASALEIVIDPKMSFGTGHHESTRLALRALPGVVPPGANVLDAGTGTGVLAIAAARLGASAVTGVDIDPWSVENALENVAVNGVQQVVTIRPGSAETAQGPFDVVVANINRNVLLESLATFRNRMNPDARLVLAGLLKPDRAEMLRGLDANGLLPLSEASEGDWWSVIAGVAGS